MREINLIIIHCSDSEFGNAQRIREWHLERGFSDIGYHFVINNGKVYKDDEYEENVIDGEVENGRDISIAGAHAYGYNSNSIGICLIGKNKFTDKQFESLRALVRYLKKKYNIEKVIGHCDVSNKTCPNFNVKEFLRTV